MLVLLFQTLYFNGRYTNRSSTSESRFPTWQTGLHALWSDSLACVLCLSVWTDACAETHVGIIYYKARPCSFVLLNADQPTIVVFELIFSRR